MIYDILPVNNYLGNNSSNIFEFDFLIDNPSQLAVYLFDEDNSKYRLIQDIDYLVENTQNKHGGHIVFPISGSKYGVLNEKQKISLELDIPVSQETQYNNSSLLNLSALEYSFDYLTRLVQIIKRKLSLCVKVEECSENTPQDLLESINNSAIETKNNALTSTKILSEIKKETDKIVNHSYFTNAILEIPQRIKLELTDGTLTLKAGSEIIIPNGFEADGTTPKFNYTKLPNDAVLQKGAFTSASVSRFIGITADTFGFWSAVSTYANSGNTQTMNSTSAYTYSTFYNTETNKMYKGDGTAWVEANISLPIALIENSTSEITSINQTFNGIGYIGSTLWVDKGVKGLIPNGRKQDGMLNNIEFTTTNVGIRTNISNVHATTVSYYAAGGVGVGTGHQSCRSYSNRDTSISYQYVEDENKTYVGDRNYAQPICILADITCDGTKITSLKPKLPFRAVDYNNKSEISTWALPSSKYIQLTRGASGTTYTAPANGYFVQAGTFGATVGYVLLDNLNRLITQSYGGNSVNSHVYIPVKKGDVVKATYSNTTNGAIYFIYAQGEV